MTSQYLQGIGLRWDGSPVEIEAKPETKQYFANTHESIRDGVMRMEALDQTEKPSETSVPQNPFSDLCPWEEGRCCLEDDSDELLEKTAPAPKDRGQPGFSGNASDQKPRGQKPSTRNACVKKASVKKASVKKASIKKASFKKIAAASGPEEAANPNATSRTIPGRRNDLEVQETDFKARVTLLRRAGLSPFPKRIIFAYQLALSLAPRFSPDDKNPSTSSTMASTRWLSRSQPAPWTNHSQGETLGLTSMFTRLFSSTPSNSARTPPKVPVKKPTAGKPTPRRKHQAPKSENFHRIRILKQNMFSPAPPPLRMARLRYLRHWTIHRAWQLFRRNQHKAIEQERSRMHHGMYNACEELRKTVGPGNRGEGYLYRVAMEKKGVWGTEGVPIEYARFQTEYPAKEAWNHEWKR